RLVAPALLTRRSTPPKRCTAAWTSLAGSAGSRRSTACTRHSVVRLPARVSRRSRERAARTSFIPSPARVSARARPIPLLAPVTMATLPASCRSMNDSSDGANPALRANLAAGETQGRFHVSQRPVQGQAHLGHRWRHRAGKGHGAPLHGIGGRVAYLRP